jgi:hypothetical protein
VDVCGFRSLNAFRWMQVGSWIGGRYRMSQPDPLRTMRLPARIVASISLLRFVVVISSLVER